MEKLSVTITTRTPLWTGSVQGETDRLHETGMLGSLRWWYETIVRGLDSEACDPTGEHRHLYNPKIASPPEEQLCPACYLFGATSWRRLFKLAIHQSELQPQGPKGRIETTGNRYSRDGRTYPAWFFNKGKGKSGQLRLEFTPLSTNFKPILIEGTLRLIGNHGGLASKTQFGYGWIELGKKNTFNPNEFVNSIPIKPHADPELPSLTNMFFAVVRTTDPGVRATRNLRFDIRKVFYSEFLDMQLRHFLCGTAPEDREGSKIFATQAVNGLIRIWGWVPEVLPFHQYTREELIAHIHSEIKKYGGGQIELWREFNSPRDTVKKHETDRSTFLLSLL